MATIGRLGPPLVLMGVIFFLSAQPHLSTNLGTIDTVLRKGAHMTEFGLLFLLWWRAFGWTPGRAAVGATAIAIGYAISDELHQNAVAGRHGSPWDVAIDCAGIGLAAALALWWMRRRPAERWRGRAQRSQA